MENLEKFAAYSLKKAGTNEDVTFGSFWENGPCIVYFMRRFGCQICRWQSEQINQFADQIKEKGGRLVAIGPECLGAEEFVELKKWDGEVYYDPEKKLYHDLEMKRSGIMSMIGSFLKKSTWDSISKSKQAGVTGNLKGDIYQMGGAFGVEKGGKIVYQFKQNDFNEHADLAKLAESLGLTYTPPKDEKDAKPPVCSRESCAPVAPDAGAAAADNPEETKVPAAEPEANHEKKEAAAAASPEKKA